MTASTIRQELWDGKICQQLDLGLLQEVIPVSMIEELLETYQMWETRERQLNMVVIVYWIIALHLYPRLSQRGVYSKLISGLRIWRNDIAERLPVKSALSYRREQLGNELLEELWKQCAGPQCSEQTKGAFWKGMRLLALDGTVESVPDTPENRATFQYSTNDAVSHSPYPLARLLLLVECGSHLICDAELSPCRQAEAKGARLLLERHQLNGCLLLWDSGFHASAAIFQVRHLGGHVLGRVPQSALLPPIVRLVDGSSLAYIYEGQKHHTGTPMLVRVISYRFTDPRIPGAGTQTYRLVTTLLDPFVYPGKALAVLYHERWQAELVIGETRTLLRLSVRTLRSRTPQGVIQEITALLLAHTVVRTLMLRAATTQEIAPVSLSFTQAVHLMDDLLIPLGAVQPARRAQMVDAALHEIASFRLPPQRLRIQARVVKRVRSRYERKKPEHWEAPPLEPDLDFYQIILLI
jgi:hypothetical protein